MSLLLLAVLIISGNINTYSQVKVYAEVIESAIRSEEHSFRIVKVIENLEHPRVITWLPCGVPNSRVGSGFNRLIRTCRLRF